MFLPTWGLTHHTMPSHLYFAQVAHAQRTPGTADNPTKAAGQGTDRHRHQSRQREAGGKGSQAHSLPLLSC